MTNERWIELMKDETEQLSESEIKEGWHFCADWDSLLIGPGMGELDFCQCDWPAVKKLKELRSWDR